MNTKTLLRPLILTVVLANVALDAPRSHAFMIAAPITRAFSNESGTATFKVVPTDGMKATATLSRIAPDGTENVVWQKALDNIPGRVLVSNHGEPFVATLDSWGNAGGTHSIVVYNPKGEAIADLKGDDFLPKPPAPKAGEPLVFIADGGRNWSYNADIFFEPRWNSTLFIVQLYAGEPLPVSMQNQQGTLNGTLRKRGQQVRIDLKTGDVSLLSGAQLALEQEEAKIAPPVKVTQVVEAQDAQDLTAGGGPDIAVAPRQ